MEFLKALWPMAFSINEKDTTNFVVKLLLFIIACSVVGIFIGLLAHLPLIGFIFSLIGSLVELYCVVGIVLCVLVYTGVLR